MDELLQAGRITATIKGFSFVMRRRSTFVMAQARGFSSVVGQLAPGGKDGGVELQQYEAFIESVLRIALIEPRIVSGDEQADPPRSYEYADMAPFAHALFTQFMDSGVDADPT